MSTPAEIGMMIEEALNDEDDTELMSVLNSITNEEWETVARVLQNAVPTSQKRG